MDISRWQSTKRQGGKERKGDQDMEQGALPPLPRHGRGLVPGREAVPGRDSCCGGGRLQSKRKPGNSLALHPHFPQKLSLESGGGRENLKSVGPRDKPGVKRGPCAWGVCPELPPPSIPVPLHHRLLMELASPPSLHRIPGSGALNTPHPDCPRVNQESGNGTLDATVASPPLNHQPSVL